MESPAKRSGNRPSERPFISGLLLAAGTSSRFGDTKQLATFEGVTLAKKALLTLQGSRVDEVVVVVGHRSNEVEREVRGDGVKVVLNSNYKDGLASSLKTGIEALDEKSDAVVVCLADQPLVSTGLIDSIISRYLEDKVSAVTASSAGVVSPPVLLSRSLYREVDRVQGDVGAKAIVMKQPDLQRVEVEAITLTDVDTPDALDEVRAKAKSGREEKERDLEGS